MLNIKYSLHLQGSGMARKLAQVVFRGTILYMAQYFLFTVILLTAPERVADFVLLADSILALV
jgi:hypothetical protein